VLFYLLVVAILNLGLGYALAVALGHHHSTSALVVPRAVVDLPPPTLQPPAPPSHSAEAVEPVVAPALLADDQLPETSSALNEAAQSSTEETSAIREKSPEESSIDDFLNGLRQFRQHISQLDHRVRGCAKSRSVEELEDCVEALREVSHRYLEETEETVERIPLPPEDPNELSGVGRRLRSAADSQAMQVRTTHQQLDDLNVNDDFDSSYRKIITHTTELVSSSAHFQQELEDAQLAIARKEGWLEQLDPQMLVDHLTELPTRASLEAAIEEQWKKDPNRSEVQIVALIDIDHCTRINQQQGHVVCDSLLKAVATLIREAAPKSMVARYGGQKFSVLFTGDAPSQAVAAVEKIRQSLEATSFEHEGVPLQVTVSCALARVKQEDTLETLFTRLMHTLGESKQYGRNRTFVDEGNAPSPVAPPELELAVGRYKL